MENQKKVWDNIAPEWYEFKTNPYREVQEFLKNKNGNILDLGSGSGRHLFKTKGKMHLVDFSDKMINLAKKRAKEKNIKAEFKVSDISKKIPYGDYFFDSAIYIAALHCIPEKKAKEKSIKELYRVLKNNAECLVAVWDIKSKRFKNSPKEKLISWRNKGKRYYYLFDEKEIYSLFKKNGFKITKKFDSDVNIIFIVKKSDFH